MAFAFQDWMYLIVTAGSAEELTALVPGLVAFQEDRRRREFAKVWLQQWRSLTNDAPVPEDLWPRAKEQNPS
jgi:hypothetical protein